MNNRHKSIDKLNTKDKCPCCKSKVSSEDYYDESGLVETYMLCSKCGYMNHYAYGNTKLSIGSKSFYFTNMTSNEDVQGILVKFNVAFKKFKRNDLKYFIRMQRGSLLT